MTDSCGAVARSMSTDLGLAGHRFMFEDHKTARQNFVGPKMTDRPVTETAEL